MATQIVMDRTGDTRHHFDNTDVDALSKAEERFARLINWPRFYGGGSFRFRWGRHDPDVRRQCGRDIVLPAPGRWLEFLP